MSLFSLIVVFILVLLTCKSHQDQQIEAVEMFKSTSEMLDNASKLPLEKQNAKKMFELVKPNLFGIVCDVKIESAKIGENLQKIHKNFCEQLNEGKSIEEIAQNVKKTVAKTAEIVVFNSETFEKMPQKIQKLPFISEKNKQMLRAFVGHLLAGNNFLTKIAAHIKNVIANKNNNTNKKCSAKNRSRRRRKRGDDLDCGDCDLDCGDCGDCCDCFDNCCNFDDDCCCFIFIGGSRSNNNNNTSNNTNMNCCYCCTAKCCKRFWLFIVALACVGGILLCVSKMHQISAANGGQGGGAHQTIGHLIAGMVSAGIFLALSLSALMISYCGSPADCCCCSKSTDDSMV